MHNETKFKEYMTMLCEMHDKALSPMLISLYWKALEPFTDEQCERAFTNLIYSSRFFPKPVDLLEAINGSSQSISTSAWIEVLETVKRVGHYQSVKFSDPVIHSVINAMGGWIRVAGEMTQDEEKWKQKEFERLYDVLSKHPRGKHPEYLPGWVETSNAASGYDVANEIIPIGFDQLKMIEGGRS